MNDSENKNMKIEKDDCVLSFDKSDSENIKRNDKLYEVRFGRRTPYTERNSVVCCRTRTAGIFTDISKAKAVQKQIHDIMEYSEERKYDTYIHVIEVDDISDYILKSELKGLKIY